MFWVFLLVLQGQEKSDSYWNVPPTNMSITALRVFQDINISFQTTMHWWHRYNSCVICACTVLSIDQRFPIEMRLRVGSLSLHLGKWHGGRGRCLGATKCKHCRFGRMGWGEEEDLDHPDLKPHGQSHKQVRVFRGRFLSGHPNSPPHTSSFSITQTKIFFSLSLEPL